LPTRSQPIKKYFPVILPFLCDPWLRPQELHRFLSIIPLPTFNTHYSRAGSLSYSRPGSLSYSRSGSLSYSFYITYSLLHDIFPSA
jgi:hypothetical protein